MGQKERILELALKLMAERGSDGMSMRDLAAEAKVNVATIYHYFPSKRDLLTAILDERGYLDTFTGALPSPGEDSPTETLSSFLNDSLQSMLVAEDYIRLMLGEALHGDNAAQSLGEDLLRETEASLARWLQAALPSLASERDPASVARLLRAVLIGLFVEHLSGSAENPSVEMRARAEDIAKTLMALREAQERSAQTTT